MSKRPKIMVTSDDLDFINKYIKKKGIKIVEASKIEPPYASYDFEARLLEDYIEDGKEYNKKVIKDIKARGDKVEAFIKYRFTHLGKVYPPEEDGCRHVLVNKARIVCTLGDGQGNVMSNFSCTYLWSMAEKEEDIFSPNLVEKFEGKRAMYNLLQMTDEKAQDLINLEISGAPQVELLIQEASDSYNKKPAQFNSFVLFVTELHTQVSLFLAYFKPEILKEAGTRVKEASPDIKPQKKIQHKKKKQKKQSDNIITVIQMSKFVSGLKEGKVKLPRRRCAYAFQVRGHFRVYKKTGKKIWIAEYTKNQGKKKKNQIIKIQQDKKDYLEKMEV